ncbi:hypothetical protein SGPA1_50367 [Streptomyces misionensis JCM 4497]
MSHMCGPTLATSTRPHPGAFQTIGVYRFDYRHQGHPPPPSHRRRRHLRRAARRRRPLRGARAGRHDAFDRGQGRLCDEQRERFVAVHQGRGHHTIHRLHHQDHDREGRAGAEEPQPRRHGDDPEGVQRLRRQEQRLPGAPDRGRQGHRPPAAVRPDAAVRLRRRLRPRGQVRLRLHPRRPRVQLHRQDEQRREEPGSQAHALRLLRRHRQRQELLDAARSDEDRQQRDEELHVPHHRQDQVVHGQDEDQDRRHPHDGHVDQHQHAAQQLQRHHRREDRLRPRGGLLPGLRRHPARQDGHRHRPLLQLRQPAPVGRHEAPQLRLRQARLTSFRTPGPVAPSGGPFLLPEPGRSIRGGPAGVPRRRSRRRPRGRRQSRPSRS